MATMDDCYAKMDALMSAADTMQAYDDATLIEKYRGKPVIVVTDDELKSIKRAGGIKHNGIWYSYRDFIVADACTRADGIFDRIEDTRSRRQVAAALGITFRKLGKSKVELEKAMKEHGGDIGMQFMESAMAGYGLEPHQAKAAMKAYSK